MKNISCLFYRNYFKKYNNYILNNSSPEEREYFKKLYKIYTNLCLTK